MNPGEDRQIFEEIGDTSNRYSNYVEGAFAEVVNGGRYHLFAA